MRARACAAAIRILREIEGPHLAERPWGILSQGERQRVLIGRALIASPRLLILDEPCAGLDPAAREHFLQFLQRLCRQRKGPAVVLVTHHVEEIVSGFSHLLVLKNGEVLAAGKISAVLNAKILSSAFDTRLRLQKNSRGYSLAIPPRKGVVI